MLYTKRGGKKRERGRGKKRTTGACWSRAATFVARDNPNYRSQLDYVCANLAALPLVKDSQVHWMPTLQRHGEHYDHAAVEVVVEMKEGMAVEQVLNSLATSTSQSPTTNPSTALSIELSIHENELASSI